MDVFCKGDVRRRHKSSMMKCDVMSNDLTFSLFLMQWPVKMSCWISVCTQVKREGFSLVQRSITAGYHTRCSHETGLNLYIFSTSLYFFPLNNLMLYQTLNCQ